MRAIGSALFVGVLFGAGLVLSDMINPARVLAFLDLAGAWDPTLALVMIGALIPATVAFAMRPRLVRPLFAAKFFIPENRTTDAKLLLGAALFGIGWGLVGFCPGPAIAALVLGTWQAWLFVAAMLAGMAIERIAPSVVLTPKTSHQPGTR